MTTIFTRNIVVFIICVLLTKGVINNTVKSEIGQAFNPAIQNNKIENFQLLGYSTKDEDILVKKITNEKFSYDKFCLSVNTSFPVIKPNKDTNVILRQGMLSEYLLSTYIWDNTVGTVNIIYPSSSMYNAYKQKESWYNVDAIPLLDIISEKEIVVKVDLELSVILDQRMKLSSNIGYILDGTVLEEIYFNRGINKIEKAEFYSKDGYFYLLELASDNESSMSGESFLSRIDNIRRFVNR